MRKYRATVQITGLTGENPRAVRAALDEQLRQSGIEHCTVLNVDFEPPPRPPRPVAVPPDRAARRRGDVGGIVLALAAAWAIWFFWLVLSSVFE